MAKVQVYLIKGWDNENGVGVMPPTKCTIETINRMGKGLDSGFEALPETEELVDEAVLMEGRYFPTKWP